MVDEQELHHALAAFLRHRRIRTDAHAFGDVLRAGDLRPGNPVDDGFAVRPEFGLAVRAHLGHAHFDQAHAAVAGRGEFRVVAVARHVLARLRARFDDARALGKLVPDAVHLHVQHLNGRGSGGRGGVAHRNLLRKISFRLRPPCCRWTLPTPHPASGRRRARPPRPRGHAPARDGLSATPRRRKPHAE